MLDINVLSIRDSAFLLESAAGYSCVIIGGLLWQNGRWRLACLILTLAILFKPSAAIFAPFWIFLMIRKSGVSKVSFQSMYSLYSFAIFLLLITSGIFYFNSENVYNIILDIVGGSSDFLTIFFPFIFVFIFYLTSRVLGAKQDFWFQSMVWLSFFLAASKATPVDWATWGLVFLALTGFQDGNVRLGAFLIILESMVQYSLDASYIVVPDALTNSWYLGLHIAICLLFISSRWFKSATNGPWVRLNEAPMCIAIGGDSGVGKDTLVGGIRRCLPVGASEHVSGDDYHIWERGNKFWSSLTHLNPVANDISKMLNDVCLMLAKKKIYYSPYDHASGRKLGFKVKSWRPILFFSGLHPFFSKLLNSRIDLKIFIVMDQQQRILYKVRRDTNNRGYALQTVLDVIKKRQVDYQDYVERQRGLADLVFEVESTTDFDPLGCMNDSSFNPSVRLRISSVAPFIGMEFRRALVALAGASIEVVSQSPSGFEYVVYGEPSSVDLESCADYLFDLGRTELFERWEFDSGVRGIMQLVVLIYVDRYIRSNLRRN